MDKIGEEQKSVTIDGIDIQDNNTTNPGTMEFGYGFFKADAGNGCQYNSIINSTVSNESAPKSFVKLASVTTSFSSTPNLSTIIALTLDAMSDIISIFKFKFVGKNKKLYFKTTFLLVNVSTKIKNLFQNLLLSWF
jgi:hypothetical protein